MKKRLLAVILVISMVSLLAIGTVQAQTISAGVKPGDQFDYHVSANWSSSDEYQSIPAALQDYNRTSHVELRITTVNTTHVVTFVAYYYNNGTDPFATRGNVNFLTGLSYGDNVAVAIIGANLNAGDLIHPDGDDGIKIKDTVTRNYESGSRATNHIQITNTNTTAGYTATRDQYFDKATGVLVEEVTTVTDTPTSSTTTTRWVITSVTGIEAWTIPEFPALIAIPLFMAATAIAVIAFKKKQMFVKL